MFHRVIFLISVVIASLLHSCKSDEAQQDLSSTGTEDSHVSQSLELPDSLFFWEHTAPIIFENCTPCHHPDGAGPFPLVSFTDVKKRLKTIKLAINDGFMPPWPADPNYRHFKNEKILSKMDKTFILEWIKQGGLEGQIPVNKPEPRLFQSSLSGPPDVVIPFPDTVKFTGENIDKFRLAKIAFELPKDTIIKAIAFNPGNKQLVHHVNGHLINYDSSKKEDPFSGEWLLDAEEVNSLEGYRRLELFHDDGSYPRMLVSAFNYLPGVEPTAYPDDLGNVFVGKKGAFLLNTLHFGPSPIDTFDISSIGIYYADKRPKRPLRELHMGTLGVTPVKPEFVIYADSICSFSTEYIVPQDISVLTINPHMHLLGSSFKAYATSRTKQDTIPLISIPKWDFRWQYFYTYDQMLKIPKGYKIVVEAVFDNTMENPYNPNVPPQTLYEGGENMKTTDEMFQFFITYVPYLSGDESKKL